MKESLCIIHLNNQIVECFKDGNGKVYFAWRRIRSILAQHTNVTAACFFLRCFKHRRPLYEAELFNLGGITYVSEKLFRESSAIKLKVGQTHKDTRKKLRQMLAELDYYKANGHRPWGDGAKVEVEEVEATPANPDVAPVVPEHKALISITVYNGTKGIRLDASMEDVTPAWLAQYLAQANATLKL